MGCHTWFYKKVATPPVEEARAIVLKFLDDEIVRWERLLGARALLNEWELETRDQLTKMEAKQTLGFWGRKRVAIMEAGADAVLKECAKFKGMKYIPGRGMFDDVDDYHDVFRKYGYPDDMLFSLEEALAYIEDPANECTTNEDTRELLERYWAEYPDGMIRFG
jgi:hypothetical protein